MRNAFLKGPVFSTLLFLSACGGGGGGGGGTTTVPTAPPPNQAPQAVFTTSTADGFAPLSVTFDAGASTDSDGTITSFDWDFGDGTGASGGAGTSHVFAEPGSYNVVLTVTDDDGAVDTQSAAIRARGAQLSGTIQILASSAIDSDTNDRLTQPSSNNDFVTAQPISNPVLLGGFVNLPGTGEATGGLFGSGDPGDFYAVNMAGGELILLSIADAGADLDLALYDAQGNLVDASVGVDTTESLSVANAGAFFVEVYPADPLTNVTGASNYVLSIGQDLAPTARPIQRLSDPFVPGEILLSATSSHSVRNLQSSYALREQGRAGAVTRAVFDRFDPTRAALASRAARRPEVSTREALMTPDQQRRYQTLLAIKGLNRDDRVALAEANLLRFPNRVPNDPFYGLQWHYPAINLPAAWDITTGAPAPGGDDVIVAVIDTGVLLAHPDLSGQLVPGYDFISDAARARDGDGIDDNPNDNGDLAYGSSSTFHGTHVAGTVAAEGDNAEGVTGVSWNAKIMPIRALGVDGGSSFDVMQGALFAAGLSNDSGTLPNRRADIINMSLGSNFSSAAEQAAIDQIRAAGVIVIASAGNESLSTPSYPAAYNGVIAVSATTISSTLAVYSNTGADLAAPGGFNATDLNGDGIGDGVVSSMGDDSNPGPVQFGYAALNGTSMAAPHVAGVAALMKAVHPGLTPAEFDTALLAGDLTDDLGTPGRDALFGNGLINAQKAVLTALALANGSGSDPGPILNASASALNFGVLTTDLEVMLENIGSGTIVISAITASEAWLSATPSAVDANGLGTYTLSVDRAGLADGSYNATITFTSQAPTTNDVSINVVMQVASTNFEADAGLHYVIVVDDAGLTVGNAAVVTVSNGVYNFTIADVPPGDYQIYAGTDMDDDERLCDAGEACGAFRTLDAPQTFTVDANVEPVVTGLDFVSEFRAVITNPTIASDPGRESGAGNNGSMDSTTDETTQDGIRYSKPN